MSLDIEEIRQASEKRTQQHVLTFDGDQNGGGPFQNDIDFIDSLCQKFPTLA